MSASRAMRMPTPEVEAKSWKKQLNLISTLPRRLGRELMNHEELFSRLYDHLPKEFVLMRELIMSSLWRSPEHWELAHE